MHKVRETRDNCILLGAQLEAKLFFHFPRFLNAISQKPKKEAAIDNSPEGIYEIGIMYEGQSNA